jgi:nucleotide-binding universal stress UspA family protein
MPSTRITVGLDHTPAGAAALRYAVDMAVREGTAVLAVHAYELPSRPEHRLERNLPEARREVREHCQRWIHETAQRMHTRAPIRLSVLDGHRQDVLVRVARDADVLVVGSPSKAPSHATKELLDHLRTHVRCALVEVDEKGSVHHFGEPTGQTPQFPQSV